MNPNFLTDRRGMAEGFSQMSPNEVKNPLQQIKKGPGFSSEAFEKSGGAERDRTVGLLNAIREDTPVGPEIPNLDGYPDAESGD